jgi:hypothetical protein
VPVAGVEDVVVIGDTLLGMACATAGGAVFDDFVDTDRVLEALGF